MPPEREGALTLSLIGIGSGDPEHLTLAAIRALNEADLVLIPRKGEAKSDLADLRRTICAEVLTNPRTRVAEFDLPARDAGRAGYLQGVEAWHDEVAATWSGAIAAHLGEAGHVALLVWGDPSLFDSSLRIARRLKPSALRVVPGITSLQALCAAHALPLNEIGEPFLVTTGRKLREGGWPLGIGTVAVMLDGGLAFRSLDPAGLDIWWGACLGLPEEIVLSGPLAETGPKIEAARREARARHGWIMDIYILRRTA